MTTPDPERAANAGAPAFYDGRIGEAWAGTAPNGSHLNIAIGARGSATAAAIISALSNYRRGFIPFLACLEGGLAVRPATVVVNKVALDAGPEVESLTWGAAQIGITQGVLDAVADHVLPSALADELVILAAVWVDPAGHDHVAVRNANRAAMRAALADAVRARTIFDIEQLISSRDDLTNSFFRG